MKMFPLGKRAITQRAMEVLQQFNISPEAYFARHQMGDWGDLEDEDRKSNEVAINLGERIFSAYTIPNGPNIWVITEADRSATTVLLPDEY